MSDWYALGEVNYRKWLVYQDMGWNSPEKLNISDYALFGAPFGGPVALIKDRSQAIDPVPVINPVTKDKILIFTASGKKLSEIDFEVKSKVSGLGWSDQEQLIVVFEDGNTVIYDIFGKLIKNYQLFDINSSLRVIECVFWGDGIVAIASDYKLYVIDGISSLGLSTVRKYTMATGLGLHRPHSAMQIIPGLLSRSGMLEVLLGTVDGSIIVVDENEAQDQLLQERISAPVTCIAVAPNGRFLACYCRDGILTVLSSAFTTKVLDFDTKSMSRPSQIQWCGEDSVALLFKSSGVVMVGPYGDWLNFPYDEAVHIIAEQDCCRVVSSAFCEIIQRVPPATEAIKKIGSTNPAALLYDAMEAFEEGDPKSDENIRSIAVTNQLEPAVASCITAAAAEFDVSRQQALLKAASYGKSFCANFDPAVFVDAARKLRVVNNVRSADIGLPITMTQFNKLTPEVLVNRLTVRNHHLLALRVCDLLNIRNDRVLLHWACEKVKRLASTPASDEEITLAISRRLSGKGRVSYVEIANSAFMMGRRRLATMILDMEQSAVDQIPLLLSMKEDELALQKAINSSDTDLIYLTLMHLQQSRDLESFFKLVHSHTEAVSLLKIYYKAKVMPSDRSLLHSLLVFERNYMEAGTACWIQAYNEYNLGRRIQTLKESAAIFSQGRDLAFFKGVIDDQVDLLEIQRALEARAQTEFLGLTVVQTIKRLFQLSVEFPTETSRWEQEAAKIIKKYKLPEKVVCNARIDVLASLGQWPALFRLSNEKKSPTGFKPFATACIKYGLGRAEAEKYVDRIDSKEEKFDLYIDLGIWGKAVDTAFKLKDPMRLQEAARLSKDKSIERQAQELLGKL